MSAEQPGGRAKKMRPDEIIEYIVGHDDPGVTASEIADRFDVSNPAVRYRLDQLEERGEVYGKSVGSSAKIWFPTG